MRVLINAQKTIVDGLKNVFRGITHYNLNSLQKRPIIRYKGIIGDVSKDKYKIKKDYQNISKDYQNISKDYQNISKDINKVCFRGR